MLLLFNPSPIRMSVHLRPATLSARRILLNRLRAVVRFRADVH